MALFSTPWMWLIGGLLLAGLEIVVPGVYLLWVGLGAILTGTVLWLLPELGPVTQLMVFSLSMFASVAVGFVVQRKSGTDAGATMLNREMESFVGRACEAASEFRNGAGRVRLGDTTYAAISDAEVAEGDPLTIIAIEDGRLVVQPEQH